MHLVYILHIANIGESGYPTNVCGSGCLPNSSQRIQPLPLPALNCKKPIAFFLMKQLALSMLALVVAFMCTAQSSWQTFSIDEFVSVKMPGTPTESRENSSTDLKEYSFTSSAGDSTYYSVMVTRFESREDVESAASLFVGLLPAFDDSKVQEVSSWKRNKYDMVRYRIVLLQQPGTENSPKPQTDVCVLKSDNALYILSCTYKSANLKLSDRFIDSISLK